MAVPTEQEINRVIAGMNTAEDASDYADSIVFEEQQMTGTRYKYIWTQGYSPEE